jgi:hypothetical protein
MKLNMNEGAVKAFLGRNTKTLFNAIERGKYEKIY